MPDDDMGDVPDQPTVSNPDVALLGLHVDAPAMRTLREMHKLAAALPGGWWLNVPTDDPVDPTDPTTTIEVLPVAAGEEMPNLSIDFWPDRMRVLSWFTSGNEVDCLGEFTTITDVFAAMRKEITKHHDRYGLMPQPGLNTERAIDYRAGMARELRVDMGEVRRDQERDDASDAAIEAHQHGEDEAMRAAGVASMTLGVDFTSGHHFDMLIGKTQDCRWIAKPLGSETWTEPRVHLEQAVGDAGMVGAKLAAHRQASAIT